MKTRNKPYRSQVHSTAEGMDVYRPSQSTRRSKQSLSNSIHALSWRLAATPGIPVASAILLMSGRFYDAALLSTGLIFIHADSFYRAIYQVACLFHRKWGYDPKFAAGLILGSLVVGLSLIGLMEPANAQFFQGAEDWVQNEFFKDSSTAGGAASVGLVFGAMRAALIVYVGVAIIQIIQKMRQDEEWLAAAKIPLVVVVSVVLGDTLVGMIVGDGGSDSNSNNSN